MLVQSQTEPGGPSDEQRPDQPVAEALGLNLYAK